MNRLLSLIICRKSGFSQIINSIVWATIMIVSSLLVDDMKTNEFLAMMYIAGWFVTTLPDKKVPDKK
jgi:hypothetical protein